MSMGLSWQTLANTTGCACLWFFRAATWRGAYFKIYSPERCLMRHHNGYNGCNLPYKPTFWIQSVNRALHSLWAGFTCLRWFVMLCVYVYDSSWCLKFVRFRGSHVDWKECVSRRRDCTKATKRNVDGRNRNFKFLFNLFSIVLKIIEKILHGCCTDVC